MRAAMVAQRSDALKNRAHVLTVARAMIEAGDAKPSFNTLAQRAGVGVGTVYRHFPDHDALLAALVEAQFADLDALIAKAAAAPDPLIAIELLLRGAVALELKSPIVAQMLASPQRESRQLAGRLAALEAAGERILARGRKAKLFRADLKAGDLQRLVCGLEIAIRSGAEKKRAAERYVDIVLAGLRRPKDG